MQNANEVYTQIQEAAKAAKRDERFVKRLEVGDVVRQGDIYIHRMLDDHPRGKLAETRQLAVGSSKGARHVAEPPAEVYEGTTLPPWCGAGTLIGPVVVSPSRFPISHPEHPDYSLPAGTYQITHQMDERTRQRVID